ncbi:MAG: TA system VapC family ribonuclease toxin [Gemmatimonadota bacterium]
MTRLLDVNVLVALAWPNHIHHGRALAWFREVREGGWATSPVTESGFVRVSSNVRAIPDARTPQEAMALLRRLRAMAKHTFWPDDVSAATDAADSGNESGPFARVVGYRQVTDAHLVALALRHGGKLATFDEGVVALVPGREGVVEMIP